jgi:hypothetical protein
MRFLKVLPAILSFIILAAHFLREGNLPLTVTMILLPFLLLIQIRKEVITFFLQIMLALSALIWLDTAYDILMMRLSMGTDLIRMVIILSGIALFALFSAYLLQKRTLRDKPMSLFR